MRQVDTTKYEWALAVKRGTGRTTGFEVRVKGILGPYLWMYRVRNVYDSGDGFRLTVTHGSLILYTLIDRDRYAYINETFALILFLRSRCTYTIHSCSASQFQSFCLLSRIHVAPTITYMRAWKRAFTSDGGSVRAKTGRVSAVNEYVLYCQLPEVTFFGKDWLKKILLIRREMWTFTCVQCEIKKSSPYTCISLF